MRSLRIMVGLAAGVCALALFATPALAKEKAFFGEFFANIPNSTISAATPAEAKSKEGTAKLFVGKTEERYTFALACEKLKSKAKVTSEHSETFTTELAFKGCKASRTLFGNIRENNLPVKIEKGLEMEFHSNGAAALGKTEGELQIKKGTSITVKVKGSSCPIIIPAQTVPTKINENREYEFAEYETDEETESNLKKYPNGIKDELGVEWLLKLAFDIPASGPGGEGTCEDLVEGNYNAETKMIEAKGEFEGELEEIQIKNGNIGFSVEKLPEA
jgi:hypothetical protein